MPPKLIRRKTVKTTATRGVKKSPQQKLKAGQIIVIRAGKHSGKKAEILKVTKDGVVVAVAGVVGTKTSWKKDYHLGRVAVQSQIRGRIVMKVMHGSFELHAPSKPKVQHRRMPRKQRRLILKKLAELNRSTQRTEDVRSGKIRLSREAFFKERDRLERRIKTLRRELRYT